MLFTNAQEMLSRYEEHVSVLEAVLYLWPGALSNPLHMYGAKHTTVFHCTCRVQVLRAQPG